MKGASAASALASASALLLLVGCSSGPTVDDAEQESSSPEQTATELLRVTSPHRETGGTLLEGPTFGEDGKLYVVDVMAPPGEAKVLRVDVSGDNVEQVYTDDQSAFTSAQFSPADDRLYLTDIVSGRVMSIAADGSDPITVHEGPVDGEQMLPDDITFDLEGNMFVTDTRGMDGPGCETPGRVVRISTGGDATVLADNLPSPNGIVFDEGHEGLWVAQYNANRIDYFALDDTRTSVVAAHPGIHVSAGRARVDSTAVDADGNVYQAFHGKAEIAVFSSTGTLLTTISVPGTGLESATNVAVAPGTTDGYITVSGPTGGFIYTFNALAAGISQTNGG